MISATHKYNIIKYQLIVREEIKRKICFQVILK